MRWPAWIEHVRRAVIRDRGAEEQADRVDCEEYTAKHGWIGCGKAGWDSDTDYNCDTFLWGSIDSTYVWVCQLRTERMMVPLLRSALICKGYRYVQD